MEAQVRKLFRKPWCEDVTGFPAASPALAWKGRRFKWLGPSQENNGLALLEEKSSGKPVLALNVYAYAFEADPGYVGIYSNTTTNGTYSDYFISVFALNELTPIEIPRLRRHGAGAHFFAACKPVESFSFKNGLSAGAHKVRRSRHLSSIPEALIVAGGPLSKRTRDSAAASIYVWHPAKGVLTVLPQRWFTARSHDLGYEGITQVVRHPVTHRLWGIGGRIGDFELDQSGMQLEKGGA